jgi:hypothetical protein
MNFDSLLDQLPTCPGSDLFPVTNTTGGLKYIQTGLAEFVGPDVLSSTAIE